MALEITLLKLVAYGLITFIAIPLSAAILPYKHAQTIISEYHKIAAAMLKRALFVHRTNGGITLKKSRFYAKTNPGAELVRIGGEKKYFIDIADRMSTWNNIPIGIVHEDIPFILDARTIHVARKVSSLAEQNEFEWNDSMLAYLPINPDETELVRVPDIKGVLEKSGSPGTFERLRTYVEKSQVLYNKKRYIGTTAKFLVYYGVGVGSVWIARELAASGAGAGGGGGGGGVIPFFLGSLGVIPL